MSLPGSFAASAALYGLSMAWIALHGPLGQGGWRFSAAYVVAYVAMLGAWKWLPVRGGTAWMLLLAVTVRAVMLAFPASDDLFRYLWEGHVQLAGFNPYLVAPDHPALEPYRTWYWSLINHRGLATIYFPFSQWLFRIIAYMGESPLVLKIAVTAFDLGALALLFPIARRLNVPGRHLALYALNPLVILFTAGEGHIESVMVFWMVAAVHGVLSRRPVLLSGALGLAVMTNVKAIFPVLFLVPVLLKKGNRKFFPIFFLPFLLCLPFLGTDVSLLDMPLRFATRFHFNGLLFSLASTLFSPSSAYLLCGFAFGAALFAIFFLTPDPIRALFRSAAAFILCTPTLHPWYLLILAPALVLYRMWPWNVLMLTVAAIFPVYARYAATGAWTESSAALVLEYLPFACAGLWVFRTLPAGSRGRLFGPPRSVSIVIPVLNEKENIGPCLESTLEGQGAVPEIIVVDGGSSDGTPDQVRSSGRARLLESGPGRGIQIARGAAEASGDVILVLHADSRLLPGALIRMLDALGARPDAAGGAFGATYLRARGTGDGHAGKAAPLGLRLRFISGLNNFRARFLGISFGDQAQFFRNGAIAGGFPALRLMEDVELSLRIKESGELLFLPGGVGSSARRWDKRGYLGNSARVIGLVALYLFRRRFGLNRGDGADYYRRYYGSAPAESRQFPAPTP